MNYKRSQFTVINDIVNDKSHNVVHNPIPTAWAKLRGKAIVLRHPEQVLARPVSLMRQLQLEQIRALRRVEENLKGKTTRHWLWRVKDTPHAAQRWTQAVGWEAKVLPRRHQALLIINPVGWQSTAAWLQNRCNPQRQTLTNTMNLCYWCLFVYIEISIYWYCEYLSCDLTICPFKPEQGQSFLLISYCCTL